MPTAARSVLEGGNDRADYLQITGVPAALLPGREQGARDRIRPAYAYALLGALNALLNDKNNVIDWRVEDSVLVQKPSWRSASLVRNIIEQQKWLGTDAQLTATISKFVTRGYLSRKSTELAVTSQLLELLLNHAKAFFQHIFQGSPPETWNHEKGDWLGLNEVIFKLVFHDVGNSWRKLRSEVNHTISSARSKPDKYEVDHMGDHPAYWVVVSIVGFQNDVPEWSVYRRATALNFNNYVKDTAELANAIRNLCDSGVLIKDGDVLMLAPKLSALMENVFTAVETAMPNFRSKCREWKANIPK